MFDRVRNLYSDLSRGNRRLLIALLLFIDANFLGTLNGYGTLNLLDRLIGDGLPDDLVWLLQIVESISAGFIVVKVLFDDIPSGASRTLGIILSPIFMVIVTFFSLDLLLKGQDSSASFTLDLVSISTGTLTWSSTYLAIAIGLTLTYKVQRYGNFAQSELFMIGMYLSMIMIWSDFLFPMSNLQSSKDGVITWSVLIFTLIAAFVLTGTAGIIIDRLVYKDFREKKASPQVMMIASLGVALILRSLTFLRFGNGRNLFEPEGDWRMPTQRWELPTAKMRLNLGERTLDEGRTYTQFSCEETLHAETGEPTLTRIISETSKPAIEIYDTTADCITQATTNYAYHKGAVPFVIFSSVLLLMLLLSKTRLGRRMRAVADNPDLAASSGINVEGVHLTSAFLSAGISGMGGAIFAMTLRFNPETAFALLLPSFAIIVLGTIGSIPGAIVGSLVVGFVRSLSTPVLIGVGLPLGRSNYTALDGVMPYIFLIAILLIMPQGIGEAYEKWKIERLRKRRLDPTNDSDKTTLALAILPTGILGLHHWRANRMHKVQSFTAIAFSAYIFSKLSHFIGNNSFAKGACSDVCESNSFAETNLATITGRNDGTLILQDSPIDETILLSQIDPPEGLSPFEIEQWTADALSGANNSWLNMMNIEIELVNLIVNLGEFVWPLVPLLLWVYAISEVVPNRNFGLRDRAPKFGKYNHKISALVSTRSHTLKEGWTRFDDWHKNTISSLQEKLSETISKNKETISDILNGILHKILAIFPGDHEKHRQDIDLYGRESKSGSMLFFLALIIVLILFLIWLPIAESDNYRFKKVLQVSNVLLTLSIFILMSFSLNLHTGYTGMVNFGVIFFASIGAISVGILTAPKDLHGYEWNILLATLFGVILAGLIGWSLAYPTARLRTDYFAIVTISLGEITRVLLGGEPLLRVGSIGLAIGIAAYPLPLENFWFCGSESVGPDSTYSNAADCRDSTLLTDSPANQIGDLLGLGEPAPYLFLLMSMALISVFIVWWLLETLLSSPWGRTLKAIREDEEVAQHHGHDILTHKAASLALGASIASLAGAFWAWKLTGFEPSFMAPARSTFLVWAAFIIGGTSNNRGMVVGAFIIVLMEFVFNVLVAGQGSADLPLHTTAERIDILFEWLITSQWDVVGTFSLVLIAGLALRYRKMVEIGISGCILFGFSAVALRQRSIDESFFGGVVTADMLYVKLLLIGCLMLFSLKYNPKGLLPEVPSRPDRPIKIRSDSQ